MPIKFDALRHARNLVKAGIPQDQAYAHTLAFLAALGDLATHRSDAEARLETLYSELNNMWDTAWAEMNSKSDALWANRRSI